MWVNLMYEDELIKVHSQHSYSSVWKILKQTFHSYTKQNNHAVPFNISSMEKTKTKLNL